MPVYPGDPGVTATPWPGQATVAQWSLGTHSGTHVDAPVHVVAGGRTMSEIGPTELCGEATVLNVKPGAPRIEESTLRDSLPATLSPIVLLATGHDTKFGTAGYFRQWPDVTPEFAEALWLRGMRVLGLDTPSPDPAAAGPDPAAAGPDPAAAGPDPAIAVEPLVVHSLVLGRDGLIVENLRRLRELPPQVDVTMFPLALHRADAAPLRAVAHG